jgi:hypothetical protein
LGLYAAQFADAFKRQMLDTIASADITPVTLSACLFSTKGGRRLPRYSVMIQLAGEEQAHFRRRYVMLGWTNRA